MTLIRNYVIVQKRQGGIFHREPLKEIMFRDVPHEGENSGEIS